MAISKQEKEFVAYLIDLMQPLGPVSARSMFGGHGIFLHGLMFALVADSVLYFKVDEEFEQRFLARELEAFTYDKQGKTFKMSYYQAPEEVLESEEEMGDWANRAYQAAVRVSNKKKR